MPLSSGFILGFDPGGKNHFGWSLFRASSGQLSRLDTDLANDAEDAIEQSKLAIRSFDPQGTLQVLAAGIDAPLFWSARGNRQADDILRTALRITKFPTPGGTVQQVNSLRGACLVQGTLLGKFLQETWPNLQITEAHPKALQHLLPLTGQSHLATMVTAPPAEMSAHEWDATLCAVAAWAMVCQSCGWYNLHAPEPNPVQPFDTPVGFWMPLPRGVLTMLDQPTDDTTSTDAVSLQTTPNV